MKKALTILALSLALVLAVGLVACNDPTGGGSVNGKFDALNTTESVYGFSAASAGMLISSMNGAQPACDVATMTTMTTTKLTTHPQTARRKS